MSSETLTLDIRHLGAQADGVADGPSGPVYIPRSLPGERVLADVDGARGRLIEVLQASPDRVTPPCPHFGACGGCAAQHIGAGPYLSWKQELVRTAFSHRGLSPEIADVVAVAPGTRRRATFTASRRRDHIALGFFEDGSHTLVDISVCPVVVPEIARALSGLRDVAGEVLAGNVIAEGQDLRLSVTATPAGLDVAMDGLTQRLDARALARIGPLATAARIIRITVSGEIMMQSAVPKLVLGNAEVVLPPVAFIQATAEAEAAMRDILTQAVGKARRIADLFCGLGTLTFALARRARVLAVDGDKAALAVLAAAAKAAPGVKPIETRLRDLHSEPLSRTELSEIDAVVFDPPRAGAKAQAEVIARSKVPVVCAVSCNPATLARDCRILVDGGYEIERVVPIDQFVWSPHVEAVAVLRRPRGR